MFSGSKVIEYEVPTEFWPNWQNMERYFFKQSFEKKFYGLLAAK